eukprot:18281-Rhodomonas_salina.2
MALVDGADGGKALRGVVCAGTGEDETRVHLWAEAGRGRGGVEQEEDVGAVPGRAHRVQGA